MLNHAETVDGQSSAQIGHMSTQTVFSVLDYLTRWKRNRIQSIVACQRTQPSKSTAGSKYRLDI